ncbi:MAG: hypothetical protein HY905_08265 [Deltaproteobacteria bacterium]|nr:hypothetical protein [Deltaproteobacteria bacterium]
MSYQPQSAPVAPPGAGMPPQGPMGPAPVARKSGAAMVGAVLALAGAVLILVATLGHSWLRPEDLPEGVSGGMGLWSYSMEGHGKSTEGTLSDMVKDSPGSNEDTVKLGMYAYGSMAFYVVNWLVIVMLVLGSVMGFARWAAAKPAGVPFSLTLIGSIVAIVAFLAWLGVSVLMSEALNGMDLGGMMYLWLAGAIAAFVGAILFAKVRSARAFGAGFQGSGAMLPPGAGTVGGSLMPPGQGVIQNPADTIGRPQ